MYIAEFRRAESAIRLRTASVQIPKFVGIRPARHPAWLRCSSFEYSRYAHSSRLAIRAPRRPRCNNELLRRDTSDSIRVSGGTDGAAPDLLEASAIGEPEHYSRVVSLAIKRLALEASASPSLAFGLSDAEGPRSCRPVPTDHLDGLLNRGHELSREDNRGIFFDADLSHRLQGS